MIHIRGRSGKRSVALLGATCSILLLSLFAVPSAFAVHDVGVFELEGNAVNEAAPGDDWDNVCYQVAIEQGADAATAEAKCSATTGTTNATATAWTAEQNKNSSIFTGGGSKDPQDISNWAYKNDVGGLPDKDNLEHAFAARYTATSSNCGLDANGDPLTSCDVVYFGSDRFDNSGDAQQGFWFLQNAISPGVVKSGGGFGFDGVHKNGDLLVISDFSVGGTTSVIKVFKWDDTCKKAGGSCADTNLRTLSSSNAAKCGGSTPDAFCGIVNPTNGTTAPWDFLDKSGNDSYLRGELYEAGINLSSPEINLGGECFATVVSETRSSTSPTATLKDFVLSTFGKCESGVSSSQTWLPNDSGTVTVTGKAKWKGTVDFTLYDGPDCGIHNADGSDGPTALYREDTDPNTAGVQGISVFHGFVNDPNNPQPDTVFPVQTSNTSVSVPLANGLTTDANGAYSTSWSVNFTSGTSGVPDSSRCEATTGIAINDNVSHT